MNDEFSGGEKKRAETVQLAVLEPKFAVLDEIDSGLDVDALRDVAAPRLARSRATTASACSRSRTTRGCSTELRPDRVHVFLAGRIVKSGGPELADELERTGYEAIAAELGIDELTVEPPPARRPVRRPDHGVQPLRRSPLGLTSRTSHTEQAHRSLG